MERRMATGEFDCLIARRTILTRNTPGRCAFRYWQGTDDFGVSEHRYWKRTFLISVEKHCGRRKPDSQNDNYGTRVRGRSFWFFRPR